tara:strand:+ start:827 stop:1807 length:981 start_codon:yes stop_codon:yes gene_type:complete
MNINWDSKVLHSIKPVIENLENLSIDLAQLTNEAKKLSTHNYEIKFSNNLKQKPEDVIRKTMLINTLNFAFTDFESQIKYTLNAGGNIYSDTDAMVYQIDQAVENGIDFYDGYFLRDVTEKTFKSIFTANIDMPMATEKTNVLNKVGEILVEEFKGDWLNFIKSGPKKLYQNGEGLIERLIFQFERFRDTSTYLGEEVYFLKLAQLAFWGIHRELANYGDFYIEDMENMTAFADYIVPVALEKMNIVTYSDKLKSKIEEGVLIEPDSIEEIEIRAVTLFVTAQMTEEINKIKAEKEKIIIPQLDFKLWSDFHAEKSAHHLTKTIMY